jgi:hypothetical protein
MGDVEGLEESQSFARLDLCYMLEILFFETGNSFEFSHTASSLSLGLSLIS